MKKIFLFLLIIGTLSSCSKKDSFLNSTDLLGTWTWIKSTGGISGTVETPESTGNQVTIEITEDMFAKYVNGVLEQELSYYLVKGQSIWTPQLSDLMIFEDESKQSVEMDDNKLILYDECYDCFQNEYIKQ
ncbi:MAG: hypothetical protein K9H64_09960 [Bacteroidales bacterium]|nr:hypothetical protein [Bacteroidales bacterium]MCF8456192.1 hypothetical protein [Bacteroidales bacterium]